MPLVGIPAPLHGLSPHIYPHLWGIAKELPGTYGNKKNARKSLNDLRAKMELVGTYWKSLMAEGEGFEPPIDLRLCWFSRPVLSTAQPSLRRSAKRAARGNVVDSLKILKTGLLRP